MGSNDQGYDKGSTERISVLESLQRQTTITIEKLDGSVKKLQSSIDKVGDRLAEVGKPQWNTLASWAGVIIVFIGLVGSSVISSIISNQSRMEVLLIKQQESYNQYTVSHANFSGGINEKVSALERSLLLLSQIQSKDMDIYRDSHSELKKSVKDDISKESALLDTRMQREMHDRISPIGKQLDDLCDKFYDHIKTHK